MGSEYVGRQELGLCKRCGNYRGLIDSICGNCADDLRADEEATASEARAMDEAYDKAKYEEQRNIPF